MFAGLAGEAGVFKRVEKSNCSKNVDIDIELQGAAGAGVIAGGSASLDGASGSSGGRYGLGGGKYLAVMACTNWI